MGKCTKCGKPRIVCLMEHCNMVPIDERPWPIVKKKRRRGDYGTR